MHSPETEEPNLVPLLDLVLQLVMFFMACTSFARENISELVRLPLAQSAKPIDDDELKNHELVYLNVEQNGDMRVRAFTDEFGTVWYSRGLIDDVVTDQAGNPVIGPSGTPMRNAALRRERYDSYFQRVFANQIPRVKRSMKPADADDEAKVRAEVAKRTLIVLRAHQQANFAEVYEILNRSRKAGFSKMQLRATIDSR